MHCFHFDLILRLLRLIPTLSIKFAQALLFGVSELRWSLCSLRFPIFIRPSTCSVVPPAPRPAYPAIFQCFTSHLRFRHPPVCPAPCLLSAVVGVGFMVLMCLGALACCIHKGRSGPEENIMVRKGKEGERAERVIGLCPLLASLWTPSLPSAGISQLSMGVVRTCFVDVARTRRWHVLIPSPPCSSLSRR